MGSVEPPAGLPLQLLDCRSPGTLGDQTDTLYLAFTGNTEVTGNLFLEISSVCSTLREQQFGLNKSQAVVQRFHKSPLKVN